MYQERDILGCDSCLVSDLMQASTSGDISGEMAREWDYNKVTNFTVDPWEWSLEQCREWLDDKGLGHPDPDPWDESLDKQAMLDGLSLDVQLDKVYLVKFQCPDCGDQWEDFADGGFDSNCDNENCGAKNITPISVEPTKPEVELSIDELRALWVERIESEEINGLDDWRDTVSEQASEHQAEIYEWWRVTSMLARQLTEINECVLENGYGCWWGRQATGQRMIMDGTLQQVAERYAD